MPDRINETREALKDAIFGYGRSLVDAAHHHAEDRPKQTLGYVETAIAAHERAVAAKAVRGAADALPGGIWPVVAIPGVNGAVKVLNARAARIEAGEVGA